MRTRPLRDHVSPHFRADIEGLRAVAVVAVVLNHLIGHPAGGFIGVDVFFVISGFLITGLLQAEAAKTGRISLVGFYKRRARRILPASLAVLAATWIASSLAFRGSRVSDAHDDIWWALGFAANIHFADIGTDYFQANRPISPVQHYWSLAVEEQFYLLWPAVVIVVLVFGARFVTRGASQLALLAVIGAIVIGSFGWAWRDTRVDPNAAYFSAAVRAWELGIGALLAVLLARFQRLPERLGRWRGPLSAGGLAAIIGGAFFVHSGPRFPATGAVVPVLATALVIFAGTGLVASPWLIPLINVVSGYLGRVSYSLYLWHFPTIVIAGALLATRSATYYAVTALAIAGLTIFSYHYIEAPFRSSAAARDRPRRARRVVAARVPLISAATLTAAAIVVYAVRPTPPTPAFVATAAQATAVLGPPDPQVAQPTLELANALNHAVAATSWPSLKPSIDTLGSTPAWHSWTGCRDVETTQADCTFYPTTTPDPAKVVAVVGDSIALSWLPAIKAALLPLGWTIYGLAKELCPAAEISTDVVPDAPATAAACDTHHQYVLDEVAKIDPSLVIMSTATNTMGRLKSNAAGPQAAAEYEAGLEQIETLLARPGRTIVTLTPPPAGRNLVNCATAIARPADCVATVPSSWTEQAAAEKTAAAATGTVYLDTHLWFCTALGYCPSFVTTMPMFVDGDHLTTEYATSLGADLAAALNVR